MWDGIPEFIPSTTVHGFSSFESANIEFRCSRNSAQRQWSGALGYGGRKAILTPTFWPRLDEAEPERHTQDIGTRYGYADGTDAQIGLAWSRAEQQMVYEGLKARPAANPRLGLRQLPLLTPQVSRGSPCRGGRTT